MNDNITNNEMDKVVEPIAPSSEVALPLEILTPEVVSRTYQMKIPKENDLRIAEMTIENTTTSDIDLMYNDLRYCIKGSTSNPLILIGNCLAERDEKITSVSISYKVNLPLPAAHGKAIQ